MGHDSGASLAFDCGSLFVSTAHYEQLMSVPSSVDRHTPCSTMSVDCVGLALLMGRLTIVLSF